MFKFMLSLGAALVMAGPAAAVDLQPGDLVASTSPVGSAELIRASALVRLNRDTGDAELISGCEDLACSSIVGLGPIWEAIEHVEVGADGELWVTTNGGVSGVEGCAGNCTSLFSVDPTSGDRVLIAASNIAFESAETAMTILVGSGYGIRGEGLEVVPSLYHTASLPGLGGWAISLLVGFLIGASYMKGKYDGKVAA